MLRKASWHAQGRALARRLLVSDSGQDLIEYALLAGLVSLVTVGVVASLGTSIQSALWDPLNVPF